MMMCRIRNLKIDIDDCSIDISWKMYRVFCKFSLTTKIQLYNLDYYREYLNYIIDVRKISFILPSPFGIISENCVIRNYTIDNNMNIFLTLTINGTCILDNSAENKDVYTINNFNKSRNMLLLDKEIN